MGDSEKSIRVDIMKRLISILLFVLPLSLTLSLPAGQTGKIVEMDVKGMTCPFCAYGLKSTISKLDGVKSCVIDVEANKARIEMKDGLVADVERIKKIIVDSGFIPGDVQVID